MKIRTYSALVALGLSLSAASANAALLNGAVSFSDGFTTLSDVVSIGAIFDIDSTNTVANAPTGDFAAFITAPDTSATGEDIDTAGPVGTLYTVGGFTFSWGSITSDTSQALSCNGPLCTDSRRLEIEGIVAGNGFDDTRFSGIWTGNGSCAGANNACASSDGYTASWSSSLVALELPPEEVPAPATLALFGLGLFGLGWSKRKKA